MDINEQDMKELTLMVRQLKKNVNKRADLIESIFWNSVKDDNKSFSDTFTRDMAHQANKLRQILIAACDYLVEIDNGAGEKISGE